MDRAFGKVPQPVHGALDQRTHQAAVMEATQDARLPPNLIGHFHDARELSLNYFHR
jgi:hypothetical protein